jgi:predicted nucleic acid-binding protein
MYTIDTSVFVNAVEPLEADHADSRRLLSAIRTRRLPMYEPTLVLAEVAGTVSRLRDSTRAARLAAILQRLPQLHLVVLDHALAQRAASLAGIHRLRGADAVYAAVAQTHQTILHIAGSGAPDPARDDHPRPASRCCVGRAGYSLTMHIGSLSPANPQ